MSDRPCARGCGVRGEHFAACPWFGHDPSRGVEVVVAEGVKVCRGCVPVEAREGALICERCYRSARRVLEDAPDLLAHLRSRADPLKAAVYDRVMVSSSRPELPAPVSADLIDASDDITRTLRAWALHVQFGPGHPWRAQGLEAGIDTASAYDDARGCADVILAALEGLANVHDDIVTLWPALIDHTIDGAPGFWTVARALAKWPLDDRARWADNPCPECDTRTVRVSPSRGDRRPARYVCTTCEWERSGRDDGGLWDELFAEDVPARSIPLGDPTRTVAHDPRWMTLAEAARHVGRTTTIVRSWTAAGEVRSELGRYWRDDVEAAASYVKSEAVAIDAAA